MLNRIEEKDVKDSSWLAWFIAGGAILSIIGLGVVYIFLNDAFVAVPGTTLDENTARTLEDNDAVVVQIANATNISGRAGEASRRIESDSMYITLPPFNVEEQDKSEIYFQSNPVSRQTEAEFVADLFKIDQDNVKPYPDDFQLDGLNKETEVVVILAEDAEL